MYIFAVIAINFSTLFNVIITNSLYKSSYYNLMLFTYKLNNISTHTTFTLIVKENQLHSKNIKIKYGISY
jgi:hypothetical protein